MQTQSIFVSIVGKPNVGKSTLLNQLVGEKTSIVSPKPQTTRTQIKGIMTKGPVQYVFLDTPGFHKAKNRLDERMSKTIRDSLDEVDAVVMLFEPSDELNEQELQLVEMIKKEKLPAIGILNKADTFGTAQDLKDQMERLNALQAFEALQPVSAVTGEGCDKIWDLLLPYAVEEPHYFPEDAFTDTPEKQMVAEIVREKILLFMRDEIPHGTAVEVDRFKERPDKPIIDIDVVIYCERKSHKGMIIGKGGQMLKQIASAAREDTEKLLGAKVNMKCWVKIKSDWRDDENKLRQLGFSK